MRFGEAVRRYTTTHLSTKIRWERTAKAETYALKKLRTLVGDSILLREIQPPTISAMKETLLEEGAKPATVNRYLADLRAVLRMARPEWGTLLQVPRFKLYRLDNERTRWLREDEKLLKACLPMPYTHTTWSSSCSTPAAAGARRPTRAGTTSTCRSEPAAASG